jgi:hypothetical protein
MPWADDGGMPVSSPSWRRRHFLNSSAAAARACPLGDRLNEVGIRGRHLLPEGSVDAPSSPSHPLSRPAPVARVVVPGVVGVCAVCELLLRLCFGPSNSDVGVAVVVGVVVAWPSSVTDVAFGSTSGSRCRVCDAPSRMLCRVGLGGRLGRLLGGIFATTAASPELAPLRCLVEGPIPHFLVVSLCLLLLGSQPPSLWFVTVSCGAPHT